MDIGAMLKKRRIIESDEEEEVAPVKTCMRSPLSSEHRLTIFQTVTAPINLPARKNRPHQKLKERARERTCLGRRLLKKQIKLQWQVVQTKAKRRLFRRMKNWKWMPLQLRRGKRQVPNPAFDRDTEQGISVRKRHYPEQPKLMSKVDGKWAIRRFF